MTRQELINMVKTKIDELTPLDALPASGIGFSDKPVDTFSDHLLDESAKEVLMQAPVSRLRVEACRTQAVASDDGSGYVAVPDDFLRLVEFKMTEWKRPVNVAYNEGSTVALRQYNCFIRGGCCKPVCVFAHRNGTLILEYYSVRMEHKLEHFLYVPVVAAEDLPVDLQDVTTWWCASRILQITGKATGAQQAYERGKSLL